MVGCKEQVFNGVLPSVDESVGYNRISPENAFARVAFASLNRQTDKERDQNIPFWDSTYLQQLLSIYCIDAQ